MSYKYFSITEREMIAIYRARSWSICKIADKLDREFQLHGKVTKILSVEFYFPPLHQPWQRGTNENTNGLLREYFPKGYDFSELSDEDLQKVVAQLNRRPRKCLSYRTPQEVYFSDMLHFACLFKPMY